MFCPCRADVASFQLQRALSYHALTARIHFLPYQHALLRGSRLLGPGRPRNPSDLFQQAALRVLYYVALYAQHKLLNGHLFLQGKLKTELVTKAKAQVRLLFRPNHTLLQSLGRIRTFPGRA